MDNEKIVTFQLQLTRRKAWLLLTAFFICWHPGFLGSETLTLTTYYPAPYGGYANLLTTGKTLLARDGNTVGLGTSAPVLTILSPDPARLTVRGGGISGNYGLTPSYTNWATYGTGDGGAAIYNSNEAAYRSLMLVGNNSGGVNAVGLVVRRVKLWDEVTVNGDLIVTGAMTGMCRLQSYTLNGGGSCSGNERVITWYASSAVNAAINGMLFLGGNLNDPNKWSTYVSVGADRNGQLLCCRIQ
jgi:hypothetical protein